MARVTERRELIDPEKAGAIRYRHRDSVIPPPWPATDEDARHGSFAGLVGSPLH